MRKIIRKIQMDGFGRVILPPDIRDAMGAEAGDSFIVSHPQDRTIELRLVKMDVCIFCKSAVFLTKTKMGFICRQCLDNFLTRFLLGEEESELEGEDTGK